jgi:Ca2+-binding EF-hand superfamily protein
LSCFQGEDSDAAIKIAAYSLFRKLDQKGIGAIPVEHFLKVLQEAGLVDKEGLHFAHLMLDLIDIDHSMTIDEHEFVAFAVVGTSVDTIRNKLLKFFGFVDEDGNGKVDFEEIDHALQYLCHPPLTEKEQEGLCKLATFEDDGIDVIELLNAVTVAKVQSLIDVYHCGRSSCGHSLRSNLSRDPTTRGDSCDPANRGETSFCKDDNPV